MPLRFIELGIPYFEYCFSISGRTTWYSLHGGLYFDGVNVDGSCHPLAGSNDLVVLPWRQAKLSAIPFG